MLRFYIIRRKRQPHSHIIATFVENTEDTAMMKFPIGVQSFEQLRNDGYTVLSEPRITGDGCYESAIADPEGNRVEITE